LTVAQNIFLHKGLDTNGFINFAIAVVVDQVAACFRCAGINIGIERRAILVVGPWVVVVVRVAHLADAVPFIVGLVGVVSTGAIVAAVANTVGVAVGYPWSICPSQSSSEPLQISGALG
jgi:hypothetical protein